MIKPAENDNEIIDCFHTLKQLRPELVEDSFVSLILSLRRKNPLTA
jgi:hypothetical protein